jgi:hypothetical protein
MKLTLLIPITILQILWISWIKKYIYVHTIFALNIDEKYIL